MNEEALRWEAKKSDSHIYSWGLGGMCIEIRGGYFLPLGTREYEMQEGAVELKTRSIIGKLYFSNIICHQIYNLPSNFKSVQLIHNLRELLQCSLYHLN